MQVSCSAGLPLHPVPLFRDRASKEQKCLLIWLEHLLAAVKGKGPGLEACSLLHEQRCESLLPPSSHPGSLARGSPRGELPPDSSRLFPAAFDLLRSEVHSVCRNDDYPKIGLRSREARHWKKYVHILSSLMKSKMSHTIFACL